MKANDIGVALTNNHFVGSNDVLLGPIETVQRF